MIITLWVILTATPVCLGIFHSSYSPTTTRCLCGEALDPVCGTDGRTYYNSCYLRCFNGLPYSPVGGPALDPGPSFGGVAIGPGTGPSFGVPMRPGIGGTFITRPVITGARPYEDCREGDGHDYDGILSITADGQRCTNWADHIGVYPIRGKMREDPVKGDNFPEGSVVGASNYCRNPDRDFRGPWCYTGYRDPGSYGFCAILRCSGYGVGLASGVYEGYRPGMGPDSIIIGGGSGTTVGPGPGKRSISLFAEGSLGIGLSNPGGYGSYSYRPSYEASYGSGIGSGYGSGIGSGYGSGYVGYASGFNLDGISSPGASYSSNIDFVGIAYEGECRGVLGSPGWGLGPGVIGGGYCRDNPAYSHFCQNWSRNGYCIRSRDFMAQHCARACNQC